MFDLWASTSRRSYLLGSILLILSSSFFSFYHWYLAHSPPAPMQQLMRARSLWERQRVVRYGLLIEEQNLIAGHCLEHGAVREGRLVNNPIGCATTITDLFARIERFLIPSCNGSSCTCLYVGSANVVYDPQLGYPRSIELQRTQRPNWLSPSYWKLAWDSKNVSVCQHSATPFQTSIRVRALKPY